MAAFNRFHDRPNAFDPVFRQYIASNPSIRHYRIHGARRQHPEALADVRDGSHVDRRILPEQEVRMPFLLGAYSQSSQVVLAGDPHPSGKNEDGEIRGQQRFREVVRPQTFRTGVDLQQSVCPAFGYELLSFCPRHQSDVDTRRHTLRNGAGKIHNDACRFAALQEVQRRQRVITQEHNRTLPGLCSKRFRLCPHA